MFFSRNVGVGSRRGKFLTGLGFLYPLLLIKHRYFVVKHSDVILSIEWHCRMLVGAVFWVARLQDEIDLFLWSCFSRASGRCLRTGFPPEAAERIWGEF